MGKWVRTATATLAICSALAAGARGGPRTWEYAGGQWPEVRQPTTVQATAPELDRAEQMLVRHEWKGARQTVLDWYKSHSDSPLRDRALYLLGEAYFQKGDRIQAFYHYDQLLDQYPDSRLFYPALEKQFQIADDFLKGYKRRFLLLPILPADEDGIEMLYRIQQRSPGSTLAERALLRTADYYYAEAEYDLAADAYNAYARDYPRNPEVPRVRLRAAFASLAQFRGLRFDPTAILDARAQLVDIRNNYPDLASEQNVPSVIEQIDSAFAKKILITGQYYERVHDPKGAVYHYRYLVATYPDSPEARDAQARLNKFPPADKTGPAPTPGRGYAPGTAYVPTTQPSDEGGGTTSGTATPAP